MKSVMSHSFAEVNSPRIPRSSFNRSHGVKTTFDFGYLVPVFVDEILPGDTCNLTMAHFARLATPLRVPMDNMYLDTFYFFVPTRLVWDNFAKFHGEQIDPGDTTDYQIPTMTAPTGGYANGTLSDYLGLPTQHHASNDLIHISLLHRAYNLIWNTHFRDQNLQDSVVVDKDDGPDSPADYTLLRRGKRYDYFTSCLPWPQKSEDGAVTLPLGTTAPVIGDGQNILVTDASNVSLGNLQVQSGQLLQSSIDPGALSNMRFSTTQAGLEADLSTATAATIDDLILAFQVQAMYRRDARAGTRYPEIVESHYGVKPYDLLYRPLYLGGSSSPINCHTVPNTSADGTNIQGGLTSYGTSSGNNSGFVHSFAEHGYVIGLVSARADLTYQEGLDRMFSRQDRFDIYYPGLANLGEMAVLKKEIFCNGSATDETVFGYQERWSDYRYKQSRVCGKFRSNDAQTLDSWVLTQEFGTHPSLNAAFIVDDPPVDRIIAVNTEPHLIMDCFFSYNHVRPMPTYSIPSLKQYF